MAVYDANKGCSFKDREILFDTNVYLFVDGYDTRPVSKVYSNYYWQVVNDPSNKIVINDYILSEFFNRSCRDQYKLEVVNKTTSLSYKEFRKTNDFIQYMETIRDSCIHFLEESKFSVACKDNSDIDAILHEAAKGTLDFSDIIVNEHCTKDNLILVTDDYDYIDCSIDIVTANKKFLTEAASRGILK